MPGFFSLIVYSKEFFLYVCDCEFSLCIQTQVFFCFIYIYHSYTRVASLRLESTYCHMLNQQEKKKIERENINRMEEDENRCYNSFSSIVSISLFQSSHFIYSSNFNFFSSSFLLIFTFSEYLLENRVYK